MAEDDLNEPADDSPSTPHPHVPDSNTSGGSRLGYRPTTGGRWAATTAAAIAVAIALDVWATHYPYLPLPQCGQQAIAYRFEHWALAIASIAGVSALFGALSVTRWRRYFVVMLIAMPFLLLVLAVSTGGGRCSD